MNQSHNKKLIIGICGGSGSGKSTLCSQLIERIGKENITHLLQDHYYRDQSHLSLEERAQNNYDHPKAIEFELLDEHLNSLHSQDKLLSPQYDFALHNRHQYQIPIEVQNIILIEGTLLFSQVSIRDHCALKVFVDAPEDIRFQRRLQRDIQERGRTAESVTQQFQKSVAPMHNKFIEPYKVYADHLVSGTSQLETSVQKLEILITKLRLQQEAMQE